MPSRKPKSKKLKQLEEKLRILKREIAKRNAKAKPTVSVTEKSSPSKSRRSKKPNKSLLEECQGIVDRLKKLSYCKSFLEPVDWRELNIPTYPRIIKHPMDLSTVERKLQTGAYSSPYEFARDMRLIYQNACTFNKVGSPHYNAAVKFARKFEEEFERKVVDQFETNDFTQRIAKAIIQIIKREDASPFRMPVSAEALGLKDYFTIVQRPMDLGTILSRIHLYRDFAKFAEDVYLVWDNCTLYNPKDLDIHQIALRLRDHTAKQFAKYCAADFQPWQDNEELPQYSPSTLAMSNNNSNNDDQSVASEQPHSHTLLAPGPMGANLPSDSDHHTHNAMDSQSQSQFGDHMDIDMNDGSQPVTTSQTDMRQTTSVQPQETDIFKLCDEVAEQDEEEANRLMINHLLKIAELNPDITNALDFQQKEELQRGIQCLDSDHFDPLINMLQSFIPEGEGDDDEVELDVDSIDDPLQVKMYNYMLRAVRQQETERIQREGGDLSMLPSTNNNHPNTNNNLNSNNSQQQQQMEIDHVSQPQTHHTQQSPAAAHEGRDDEDVVHDIEHDDDDNNEDTEMQSNQFAFTDQHQQSPAIAAHDTAANYTFQPDVSAAEQADINNHNASSLPAVDEDHDVQMMNKSELHEQDSSNLHHAEEENAGQDIVADIANAVVHDIDVNTHNEEERRHDAEQQAQDTATPQLDEQSQEALVIPTMPALQPDDATPNQMEDENQEGNQITTTTNTETQQSEHDEKMQHVMSKRDEAKLLNEVNEVLNDGRNDDDEIAHDDDNDDHVEDDEDDEVDTPLAGDIDF